VPSSLGLSFMINDGALAERVKIVIKSKNKKILLIFFLP
jgi:hypothetical protein